MPKKQTKKRSKKLSQLKVLREKRKLLENKKQLQDKQRKLVKKITKEYQRVKSLKRETGSSKYLTLSKLVKGAKSTSQKLKKAKKEWDKFKKEH